jgi:hypothetical protein
MTSLELTHQPPVHIGEVHNHAALDRTLIAAFDREFGGPHMRQSHLELGRYENTWIERHAIPEIEPLLDLAGEAARRILGRGDLRLGFWFNLMQPGERTARHNHEEDDELLSGVYYLETPPDCGDLVVYHPDGPTRIAPCEGRFVFFAPRLAHAVEENRSGRRRLSVAFNFGLEG